MVRIGVFEWASAGGNLTGDPLPESIRQEGWAMCRAALHSLIHAGYQAVSVVDPSLATDSELAIYSHNELELTSWGSAEPRQMAWHNAYASCDRTLVIAPESEGILAETLRWFREQRLATCNCEGEFLLQASDKWLCAQQFELANVPTPPTRILSQASPQWLAEIDKQRMVTTDGPHLWALKSRDGAGCDGMWRLSAQQVTQWRSSPPAAMDLERWIVQPWCQGTACSRAAIVDCYGRAFWLPVTTQQLRLTEQVSYSGGEILPGLAEQIPQLETRLNQALRALSPTPLGWVGIDFLLDHSQPEQPVCIVEINPRLTTSFVGLVAAGAPDLAAWIIAAAEGCLPTRDITWSPLAFTASGKTQLYPTPLR